MSNLPRLCKDQSFADVRPEDYVTNSIHTFIPPRHPTVPPPQIHIEGLKGTEYLDSLDGRKRKPEVGDVLLFNGEVDRIYTSVPGNLQVSLSKRIVWCGHRQPSSAEISQQSRQHDANHATVQPRRLWMRRQSMRL